MSDDRFGYPRTVTDGGVHDSRNLSEDMIDDVCRALAEQHRRHALGYMMERGDTAVTLEELTDALESVSPYSRRQLRIALHHNHLEMLDQACIVEYDGRSKTARYHGHPLAESVLEILADASSVDSYAGVGDAAE